MTTNNYTEKERKNKHNRDYYLRNRERILEHQRQYKKTRPRPKDNPETKRRYELKIKYGISPEEYNSFLVSQAGRCGLCGGEPTKHFLCVDHDHQTGQVRGLLCTSCNTGLGKLGDTVEGLKKAIEYLEKSSCP